MGSPIGCIVKDRDGCSGGLDKITPRSVSLPSFTTDEGPTMLTEGAGSMLLILTLHALVGPRTALAPLTPLRLSQRYPSFCS